MDVKPWAERNCSELDRREREREIPRDNSE